MDRKIKGRLAEAKVLSYFVELGYEPYLPFVDNAFYDMIVVDDQRKIKTVSVKFTNTKSKSGTCWCVGLRTISRRNDSKVAITLFDSTKCDLLAVYIYQENRVAVVTCDFPNTSEIQIPMERC